MDKLLPDIDLSEEIQALTDLAVNNGHLMKENIALRYIVARTASFCVYCGIKNMGECKAGFPGCAQMDDICCAEAEAPDLKGYVDKMLGIEGGEIDGDTL